MESKDAEELSTKERPVIDATYFGADPTGTDDSGPAIRDAINYSESLGGGTVYLPAGTYFIDDVDGSSAIPLHHDNVALQAAGKYQATLRSHFQRETDVYGTGLHSTLISAYGESDDKLQNVHISDLGIEIVDNFPDGAIVGDHLEYSSVERVWVDNKTQLLDSGTSGIPIWWAKSENEQRSKYLAIRDCDVLNDASSNPALEMAGVVHGVVSNNVLDSTTGEAGVKVEGSRNIVVSNNTAESDSDTINFLSTQECTCTSNTVRSLNDKGIVIGGDDSVFNRTQHTVANNTIQATSVGINIFSGVHQFTLSGNTIEDPSVGVRLNSTSRGGTITSNTVSNCSTHCLTNDGGAEALEGATITGNVFREAGAEVVKLVSPRNTRGVSFANNIVESAVDWNTAHVLITENSNGDTVDGVTITGNQCIRSGEGITIPDTAVNFVVATNLSSINYGGSTSSTEIVANNAG